MECRNELSGRYTDPKDVDDLSSLDNLDNNVILQHLQKRFEKGQIYTYIGDVLIAINPCCDTPIYEDSFHEAYRDLRVRQKQPPHIYWLADYTYRNLLESRLKQCVVVTGDSGAGKTESTKYVLKHLVRRAKCAIPDLVDRLKTINPLLELFGNAATVFNSNSSRFGKFIELLYGNKGELLGSRIQTFVLEKSRVVYHGIGEKNFHIFHSLIAGTDEQKLLYYYIENPAKYRILHENGARPDTSYGIYNDAEDMRKYASMFHDAEAIMNKIGLSDENIHNLYQILSAILHISNIEFQEDEETDGLTIANENHLFAASAMLKMNDQENFTAALITKTTYINGEELKSFKTIRQAEDGRDSVCKELYRCLFTGIVNKVNETLKPQNINSSNGKTLSIGILDISGFENLQHNGFEQLLINITNERLHQYFQKQIFEVEYKDYKLEGIGADEIQFFDNTEVLNLLFNKIGILSILEEEIAVPGSNDVSLVSKYDKHLKDSPCYKQKGNKTEFGIVHYAGEVLYDADNFLDKNRGTLSSALKECIINSENFFVEKYFESNELQSQFPSPLRRGDSLSKATAREISRSMSRNGGNDRNRQKSGKLYDSETNKYKKSLNELNDKLSEAKPMFIRCVKPNLELTGGRFDENVVRKQLEASGVLEVTKIRKDGYPVRIKFDIFVSKYNKLLKDIGDKVDQRQNAHSILHVSGVTNYKLGKTKVFMKTGDVDKVEQRLEEMKRKEEKAKEVVKLPMLSSDSSTDTSSLTSSHSSTKKDPSLFINIPESVPIDYSQPNTPTKESPSTPSNKKEEDLTQRPAWDIFRITERDVEGCGEFEAMFLRGCRILTCFLIFVLVFASGIGSTGSLILLAAKMNKDIGQAEAATELVMCLSCPIALSWIVSLLRVLFGRSAFIKNTFLLPALVLDGIHVIGTAVLVYKVLPNFDIFTNLTIIFAVGQIPAILNLLRQIIRRRQFIFRIITIFFSVFTVIAQLVIIPLIYAVGITNHWTVDSNLADNTLLNFTDEWFIAVALVLVSIGWAENFISNDIFCIPFLKWRKALDKSRDKVILFSGPIKVAIFVGMTLILVPGTQLSLSLKTDLINNTELENNTIQNYTSGILSTTVLYDTSSTEPDYNVSTTRILETSGKNITNGSEANVTKSESLNKEESIKTFFDNFGLMILQMVCSLVCSYSAGLACKLHMQRLAFYLPLILVIPSCFGLSLYLCKDGAGQKSFFEGHLLCPNMNVDTLFARFIIGGVIAMSIITLTWYEIFPKAERMAKLERLFILPVREGLFTVMGLLLRRRDDICEDEMRKKKNERRKKKEKKDRPFVHICATMWHENRLEMLQLLKSLFRVDAYKSQGQIAEKKFKVHVDYFDLDIHVIFDDAFNTDKETKQRMPNDFVKQFLDCMNEAAESVAKGHIDWERYPKMVTTPYGGRLIWTMPGGTDLCVHLKDKRKIRHRKRWSQIMYLYYLLGYHTFENKTEADVVYNQTKRHLIRPFTSILNRVKMEHVDKAFNTFILTLDGDVDFRPDAVQLLIDRMQKNKKVGAVCGRIHPIGSGPMIWYQQFEYAVGHWLQKAAEHVFGCVLCCPGCFSLFREAALMDDNVVRLYTKPPTEATHYIQFEQGEDRWLCTLLLQQGWKIDYCAGADALTYAPETFKDFYIQRRRWAPSTLANIMDLLSSWVTTTRINDNISTPFILYQFVIMATSLLAPGTVTVMITGSYSSVLGLSLWWSYLLSAIPVLGFIIICLKTSNDTQILVAGILSSLYSVVMVIVTVGTILDVTTSALISPNVMFLSGLVAIFVVSGLLHPKEIGCLLHGILYFLTVPSSFVFLTVYYLCNLNIVTWGTREGQIKEISEENTSEENGQKSRSKSLRIIEALGIQNCIKEIISFVKQTIGHVSKEACNETTKKENVEIQKIVHTPRPLFIPKTEETVKLDPDAWKNTHFLHEGRSEKLAVIENEFWIDMLKKYLHPISEDSEHQEKIKKDLLTLRNNIVFGYFLLNLLFTIALVQLQLKEDELKSFYIVGEYEPFSVAFLCVFALVLLVQFLGMLSHRWGTYLHLVSSVKIDLCSQKNDEEYYAKIAFQEAGKLQSEEPQPDYLADVDSDSEGVDSTANNSATNTLTRDPPQVEPDYSDEEVDNVGQLNQNKSPPSAYERNFVKRYRPIRHQFKRHYQQANDYRNPRHKHNILGNSVQRNELYYRTFSRQFSRHHKLV